MIIETKVYSCRKFRSEDLVKNGTNAFGSSQYHCKACGAYGILERKEHAMEEKKDLIKDPVQAGLNGRLGSRAEQRQNRYLGHQPR